MVCTTTTLAGTSSQSQSGGSSLVPPTTSTTGARIRRYVRPSLISSTLLDPNSGQDATVRDGGGSDFSFSSIVGDRVSSGGGGGRRVRNPMITSTATPMIMTYSDMVPSIVPRPDHQSFGGGGGDSRLATTGSGRPQQQQAPSHPPAPAALPPTRRYRAGWMEQDRPGESPRLAGDESPPTGRRLGSYWRPGGFTCLDRELGREHVGLPSMQQGSWQAQQDRQRRTVIRRLFRHRLAAEEEAMLPRDESGFPASRTIVHLPVARSPQSPPPPLLLLVEDDAAAAAARDDIGNDPFFRRARANNHNNNNNATVVNSRSFDSSAHNPITPPETRVPDNDDGIPTFVFQTNTPMATNSLATPASPRHHYRSIPTAVDENRGAGGAGGANNNQRPRRTISDLLQLLQVRGQMAQQSRIHTTVEDRLLQLLGGHQGTGESQPGRDVFTTGLDLFRSQGETPSAARRSGGERPVSVVSDGIFLSSLTHGDQQPSSLPGENAAIMSALSRLDRIQRRIADLYRRPITTTEDDPFLSSRRRNSDGLFESIFSDHHEEPAWSSPLDSLFRRDINDADASHAPRASRNRDSDPNARRFRNLIPMETSSLTGETTILMRPSATATTTSTTSTGTTTIPITTMGTAATATATAAATTTTSTMGDFSIVSDPRSPMSIAISPRGGRPSDPRRLTLDLGGRAIRTRDRLSLTDEALASSAMATRRQTVRSSMMDRQETLMERFRRTSRLVSALRDGNDDDHRSEEDDRFQIQTTASILDSNGNDPFPRRPNGASQP